MAKGRYVVVVDEPQKLIVGGPYVWDPVAAPTWEPPEEGTVMEEQAAFDAGYTYPQPDDPPGEPEPEE